MRSGAALWLAVACTGSGEDTGDDGWLTADKEVGAPLATGTDFAPADGPTAWTAAEQLVPGLTWSQPAIEVPLYLWEDVALSDDVGDEGSCPYTTLSDNGDGSSTTTWHSNCRSTDGYEWSGSVDETKWSEDDLSGVRWTRWDFALDILGDNDDPDFTELHLHGVVWSGAGEGQLLVRAAQVNVQAGIDGYWEQLSIVDEREQAWHDLVLSGRWEQTTDGTTDSHRLVGAAVVGELGGLGFEALELRESAICPGEPTGDLDLSGSSEAIIRFDGETSCDRCGDLFIDGDRQGSACPT